MITEVLSGDGSCQVSVDLHPASEIARDIHDAFPDIDTANFPYLVVTAAEIDGHPARGDLLEHAIYVGIIDTADDPPGDTIINLSGRSLLPWIGDVEGVGPDVTGTIFVETLTEVLSALGDPNGVPLVLVGDDPGSPGDPKWFLDDDVGGVRYQLTGESKRILPSDGQLEYRARPGWVDVGVALGATVPRVVLCKGAADQPGYLYGMPAGIGRRPSASKWIGTAAMRDATLAYHPESRSPLPADFTGSGTLDLTLREMKSGSGDATAAEKRSAEKLAECAVEIAFSVTAAMRPDLHRVLLVGDWVWLFEPLKKILDQLNTLMFNGEDISPMMSRVFSYTYPVVKGWGVYLATNDWSVVHNLTPYMQWDTGDVTIQVGAPLRPRLGRRSPRDIQPPDVFA